MFDYRRETLAKRKTNSDPKPQQSKPKDPTKPKDPRGGYRKGAGRKTLTGRNMSVNVMINETILGTLRTKAKSQKVSLSEYLERIFIDHILSDPALPLPQTPGEGAQDPRGCG